MAQSVKDCPDGGVAADKENSLTKRRTIVKIKGYPLPVVEYFLAHLYGSRRISAIEGQMKLKDFEEALKIADEYGALSFFDQVSYVLLANYLNTKSQQGKAISLLTWAYKYSRETSEILRKGCIAYSVKYHVSLVRDADFKEFLILHGCRDLCLALALQLPKYSPS
ncbi:hypothetical protein DFS34DRAFT_2441 [Phlyctochytrium arcticum]|nr:hypothetical protein DFS34DRAFT_2441 [Phlyctochytrium arcticum]